MVYIRAKTIKGDNYLYLVKSIWDKKKNTSRQEIIKYLGKATTVSTTDIPVEYRDDPKINAFLATKAGKNIRKTEALIEKTKENLFVALTKGDLDSALDIFEIFSKNSNLEDFYEIILKPTMYKVGDKWASNELSVASEHVASNVAKEMIGIISEKISKNSKKTKILLCTPVGEQHTIGCQMLQSFLQSKGYRVFNLSPAAPSESILNFIQNEKPNIVMVSITIEDNVRAGQRLVSKIKSNYDLPVLVGGQAIFDRNFKFDGDVMPNQTITKIPKLINKYIKNE